MSSYFQEYLKKNKRSNGMTLDREQYISYLEMQLSKTSEVLSHATFMEDRVNLLEKKLEGMQNELQISSSKVRMFNTIKEDWEEMFNEIVDTKLNKYKSDMERKVKFLQQMLEESLFKINSHINNNKIHGSSPHHQDVSLQEDLLQKLEDHLELAVDFKLKPLEQKIETHLSQLSMELQSIESQTVKKVQLDNIELLMKRKYESLEQSTEKLTDQVELLQEVTNTKSSVMTSLLEDKIVTSLESHQKKSDRLIESRIVELKQSVLEEVQELKKLRRELSKDHFEKDNQKVNSSLSELHAQIEYFHLDTQHKLQELTQDKKEMTKVIDLIIKTLMQYWEEQESSFVEKKKKKKWMDMLNKLQRE